MKLISFASFTALFAAFVAAVPVPAAAPGDEVTSSGYKRGEDAVLGYKRGEDAVLGYKRGEDAVLGYKRGEDAVLGYKRGEDAVLGYKRELTPVIDVIARDPAAVVETAAEKKKRHRANPLKKA
jgi:hypothetical protein